MYSDCETVEESREVQVGSVASLVPGRLSSIPENMYQATKWACMGWTRSLSIPATFQKEKVRYPILAPHH